MINRIMASGWFVPVGLAVWLFILATFGLLATVVGNWVFLVPLVFISVYHVVQFVLRKDNTLLDLFDLFLTIVLIPTFVYFYMI